MAAMRVKKYMFWVVARTALFLYSCFPIFGRLRAAVGIIRKGDTFLVIERNDGRGVSFPGGLCNPWEQDDQALSREILEETGLKVASSDFKFRYRSDADVKVEVSVWEVTAEGVVEGSWEGTPRWLPLSEFGSRVIPGQRPVVEVLEAAHSQ